MTTRTRRRTTTVTLSACATITAAMVITALPTLDLLARVGPWVCWWVTWITILGGAMTGPH